MKLWGKITLRSPQSMKIGKILFEICYLLVVIVVGLSMGLFLCRYGLETINSFSGTGDKVFHDTEQIEFRELNNQ